VITLTNRQKKLNAVDALVIISLPFYVKIRNCDEAETNIRGIRECRRYCGDSLVNICVQCSLWVYWISTNTNGLLLDLVNVRVACFVRKTVCNRESSISNLVGVGSQHTVSVRVVRCTFSSSERTTWFPRLLLLLLTYLLLLFSVSVLQFLVVVSVRRLSRLMSAFERTLK